MGKTKVMYLLYGYPQASQTYIKTELEAVADRYDVSIVSTHQSEVCVPYRNHLPYRHLSDLGQMREAIEEVKPDVLHGHHLREIRVLGPLAEQTGVPFTLRSHSFDVIDGPTPSPKRRPLLRRRAPGGTTKVGEHVAAVLDDACLGILGFPFARPLFEAAGVPGEKFHDCWPVVNYERFDDRSPNGDAVMNCGACLPKKNMNDFVRLGAAVPDRQFNLYSLGYKSDKVVEFNKSLGEPIDIVANVEPDDMPAEYKKHEWIVYTASKEIGTVGWPMAVAEAQAAGVGVCMQDIRPDLAEYVGDAGYLFDSIEDVVAIISKPFDEQRRQLGFEQAKKSDVRGHISLLTDLWDRAVASAA